MLDAPIHTVAAALGLSSEVNPAKSRYETYGTSIEEQWAGTSFIGELQLRLFRLLRQSARVISW